MLERVNSSQKIIGHNRFQQKIEELENFIEKDKKYLVTGGSGFLGIPLVQYILSCGGQVRVMSRNEGKLVELKEAFSDSINLLSLL